MEGNGGTDFRMLSLHTNAVFTPNGRRIFTSSTRASLIPLRPLRLPLCVWCEHGIRPSDLLMKNLKVIGNWKVFLMNADQESSLIMLLEAMWQKI